MRMKLKAQNMRGYERKKMRGVKRHVGKENARAERGRRMNRKK